MNESETELIKKSSPKCFTTTSEKFVHLIHLHLYKTFRMNSLLLAKKFLN